MNGRSLFSLLQSEASGTSRSDSYRDADRQGTALPGAGTARDGRLSLPRAEDSRVSLRPQLLSRPLAGRNAELQSAAFPGAWLGDCDNGPSKTWLVEHREQDADTRRLYDLAFGKRPAEELYDLRKDPNQLSNVIDQPEYAAIRSQLSQQLTDRLAPPKIRAWWAAARRLTGTSIWVALRSTRISSEDLLSGNRVRR